MCSYILKKGKLKKFEISLINIILGDSYILDEIYSNYMNIQQ